MFERFHHDARAVVAHARDEATRSGKNEIGTGDLLLGLLAEPGHAADALQAAGVAAADVRESMQRDDAESEQPATAPALAADAPVPAATAPTGTAQGETGPVGGRGLTGGLRLTGDARRAVDFAVRAAHRFRHQHVSSGHLLLGLIDQSGTSATEALTVAGIHVGTLRADVLRRMEVRADLGPPDPDLR